MPILRFARRLLVLVCAAAALKLPGMGKEFLPEFREGHFVLQVSAAPGTSLAVSSRRGSQPPAMTSSIASPPGPPAAPSRPP